MPLLDERGIGGPAEVGLGAPLVELGRHPLLEDTPVNHAGPLEAPSDPERRLAVVGDEQDSILERPGEKVAVDRPEDRRHLPVRVVPVQPRPEPLQPASELRSRHLRFHVFRLRRPWLSG